MRELHLSDRFLLLGGSLTPRSEQIWGQTVFGSSIDPVGFGSETRSSLVTKNPFSKQAKQAPHMQWYL